MDHNASAMLIDDDPWHGIRLQGHALSRFKSCLYRALFLVAVHVVFTGFMPFERRTPRAQQQQGRAQEAGGMAG
jgi:hypothetical protein